MVAVPHHKAPAAAPVVEEVSTLPEARLTRLGATPVALGVYRAVWARLGSGAHAERNQGWFLTDLGVLPDDALAEQVATVGTVGAHSVNALADWVRGGSTPVLTAALVLEAEQERAEPRRSLVERMQSLVRSLEES